MKSLAGRLRRHCRDEYTCWTNSVVEFTAFPAHQLGDERHEVLICLFFDDRDLPETPSITGLGDLMTFTISTDAVPLAQWREICLRKLATVRAEGDARWFEEECLGYF